MNYVYNFRLFPNELQKVLLEKHFGCVRFIYNHFLHLNKEKYASEKKFKFFYECSKDLTQLKLEKEWLKEINAQSLQQTLRNLEKALKNKIKKLTGFPVFKKKFSKNSFNVPQNISVENNRIFLPKFREGIKFDNHRIIEGKIKQATVTKTKAGNYYCSILVEKDDFKLLDQNQGRKSVGIDVGLTTFCTLSSGESVKNPKYFEKAQEKLAKLQRKLAKKVKGSNNRNKARLKVAKEYERISNQRKDFLQKLSTKIINENQIISVEDLDIQGLLKGKNAKGISSASWYSFIKMLEYKASWYGRTLVKVSQFFPSSKKCFPCKAVNHSLILDDRTWICPSCGALLDRELNASNNIEAEGISVLACGVL